MISNKKLINLFLVEIQKKSHRMKLQEMYEKKIII